MKNLIEYKIIRNNQESLHTKNSIDIEEKTQL